MDFADTVFADEHIRSGERSISLVEVARGGSIVAEDIIEFGDIQRTAQQSTFGVHFVEVGVDAATGESRIRRMRRCVPVAESSIRRPHAIRSLEP